MPPGDHFCRYLILLCLNDVKNSVADWVPQEEGGMEIGGGLSGSAPVEEVKEADWEKREVGLWYSGNKALADPTESSEDGISPEELAPAGERRLSFYITASTRLWMQAALGGSHDLGQGGSLQPKATMVKASELRACGGQHSQHLNEYAFLP